MIYYIEKCAIILNELRVNKLYKSEKVLISNDHEPVALKPESADRHKRVRDLIKNLGISLFFDAGRGGLGHNFPIEMGYIYPGMFVEGYDTHVTNFGAVGALGIAVGTEITEILACGSLWLQVPEMVRINLSGRLNQGISIRDVAQKLISDLDPIQIDYTVVEFRGAALSSIGLGGRLTLCNTPCDIGAKSAIVESDKLILDYLSPRVKGELHPVYSDSDAVYKMIVDYDINLNEPQIAVPPRPGNVVPISQMAGLKINHASIGSCASGMIDDLRDAALIIKGQQLAPHVRLFITPATQNVAAQAAAEGLMEIFMKAGAMITPPGCGTCAGGRVGPLASGEVSITTGTRNDPGRLGGAQDSAIYLGSAFTVAASAVTGKIANPQDFL